MAREPHFVVNYSSYLGTAIKLVLYILKQLFASVSMNSGRYLPRPSGSVNIHRYSPPLRRIIVKYFRSTIQFFLLQQLGSTLWDCKETRGAFKCLSFNFCLSWCRLRPPDSSSLYVAFSSSWQIAFLRLSSGHTQDIFFMLGLWSTIALAPRASRPSSLLSPSVVLSS